jgi:predicted transposase YdaD
VHIELQSTNDSKMALRMAEYALAICRRFDRMPAQVVLYVGLEAVRMKTTLNGPHLSFDCRVIDIRDLDGEVWLASDRVEDNVVAVLMSFASRHEAIRKILQRIAESDPARRPGALAELLILAGLRKTGDIIKREAKRMPILNDIMDHEVIGPVLRQGMEIGRTKGRTEGERSVILRQLSQRFGLVPDWAKHRLEAMSIAEIDRIALRLLDARSLEDLFQ